MGAGDGIFIDRYHMFNRGLICSMENKANHYRDCPTGGILTSCTSNFKEWIQYTSDYGDFVPSLGKRFLGLRLVKDT